MATVLYTPEVLALAVELSRYPLTPAHTLHGEARSTSCGSSIAIGLSRTGEGVVDGVGIRSQACAIGQAAAAIFAGGVAGQSAEEISAASAGISDWLSGVGAMPTWPGLCIIAAARDYPARHGAVMLPWKAAVQALSMPSTPD